MNAPEIKQQPASWGERLWVSFRDEQSQISPQKQRINKNSPQSSSTVYHATEDLQDLERTAKVTQHNEGINVFVLVFRWSNVSVTHVPLGYSFYFSCIYRALKMGRDFFPLNFDTLAPHSATFMYINTTYISLCWWDPHRTALVYTHGSVSALPAWSVGFNNLLWMFLMRTETGRLHWTAGKRRLIISSLAFDRRHLSNNDLSINSVLLGACKCVTLLPSLRFYHVW